MDIIVYHSADADGWFSAALARLIRPEVSEYKMIYTNYGQEEDTIKRIREHLERADRVYVVDFSFKPYLFDPLIDDAHEVFWYDHHITALNMASEKMKALPGRRSNDKSAAALVFEDVKTEGMSRAVQLVSDYDMYNFDDDNPLSQDAPCFNAYVGFARAPTTGMVFRALGLLYLDEVHLKDCVNEGRKILEDQIIRATGVSKRAIFGTHNGMKWAGINSSDGNPGYVCASLYPECDFAFTWYVDKGKMVKMEFRSTKKGGTDVSIIAKSLGGGGHEHASGCRIPLSQFYEQFLQE